MTQEVAGRASLPRLRGRKSLCPYPRPSPPHPAAGAHDGVQDTSGRGRNGPGAARTRLASGLRLFVLSAVLLAGVGAIGRPLGWVMLR